VLRSRSSVVRSRLKDEVGVGGGFGYAAVVVVAGHDRAQGNPARISGVGGADSLGKLDRAWSARFVVRVLLGPPLAVALLEHFLQDTPLLDVVTLRLQLAHRSMVRRRPVPPQRRC
jgi:hypothetical protein